MPLLFGENVLVTYSPISCVFARWHVQDWVVMLVAPQAARVVYVSS